MKCEDCKFWDEDIDYGQDEDEGACRRFPPVVLVDNLQLEQGKFNNVIAFKACRFSIYPDTNKDDWCGEFQPKKGITNGGGCLNYGK